ncbi:hypothetical protein MNBD_GAMMA01-1877 [hydrothermal vent metagenome]|uniref:O-antigen ligase-related domain-containing protein n=1 Tax=hydrothermal vent metagenome TaxID=652676 RepID=A0A3B0W0I3_9ZZZZ
MQSRVVLGLYLAVMILLPFSRLAELPILILAITGIYGLIMHWNRLKNNSQFKILSLVFGCYFLLVMISAIDSYWQNKTLIVAVASIRFYLATIALLLYLQPKHFILMLKAITILATFWAVDAIYQYFVGVDIIGRASYAGRLNGIFGEHHAKLGPVLALLLPIAMVGLKTQKSMIRWASIFVIIITILLSGTRSAWLMMLFTLFAYWFHHVKQRRFQLLLKSILVASIMATSLWFISPEFQQRIERSASILQGSQTSIDFALADRLPIWQTSWSMIKQHPINGIGAHAFRKAYPTFASADDSWQQQGGVGMHAHHWVLEVLAETGIIGLILLSFAIYKLMMFVRKNYNPNYSWAFLIALISAFLPITSTYSIFASFWSICIWLIGAGLIIVSRQEKYND